MSNDLIKRDLAIAYATSGLVRNIDGEDWIRISEVKQSLNDVPTVEPKTKLVANVSFNKEELEELVEKAKADILEQIERPKGEWIPVSERLPEKEGFYLVFLENKRMVVAHSDGIIENHDFEPKMLAWMPLPEPYKKGGVE